MWKNRPLAKHFGAEFYEGDCPYHGPTAFLTAEDECLACYRPGHGAVHGNCPIHGVTTFYRGKRVCRACCKGSGEPRRPSRLWGANERRQIAARAGFVLYDDWCLSHGLVAHYSRTGLCARCFGVRGAPIKEPAAPKSHST